MLGVGVGVWQLARSGPDTVAASGGPAEPGGAQDDSAATGASTTSGSPTTETPSPGASSATASPTATPTLTGPVDRSLPVTVLNATGRGGLAGRVSTTLRSAGWTSFTGNGPSRQAVTTLYYPGADQQGTARAVAGDLGVTVRVERSQQFGTDRITLVLGADFVG